MAENGVNKWSLREILGHKVFEHPVVSGLILLAVGGGGTLLYSYLSKSDAPPVATQRSESERLKFTDTKVRPQPTNKKLVRGTDLSFDAELATFVLTVENTGPKPIHAESVGLLVGGVEGFPAVSTLAMFNAIDHSDDVEVWIANSAKAGDFIPVPLQLEIEPKAHRDFGVWFKSTAMPKDGVLRVRGRMQIRTSDGPVTSEPIEIVIHSDSQEMHYSKPDGV